MTPAGLGRRTDARSVAASVLRFCCGPGGALRGLGEGYRSHPDFVAFFSSIHAELPEFIAAAIVRYVDDLETAEIQRLLAADEGREAVS